MSLWIAISVMGRVGAAQGLQEFGELRAAAGSSIDQAPLAVLRIPRIALEVVVREGTDDWTLNQGVGLIEETSRPGAGGNVGIAGHRDGFFRRLKEIRAGDVLEIETTDAVHSYQVARTWIVQKNEVSVLNPTAEPSVTLVTCYPFYFVGSAPERFIVRAVRTGTRTAGAVSG